MLQQDPLLSQLAHRVRNFSTSTGVSLNRIAKEIESDSSNFSAFVNGRAGLSATSVCRLLELLNSPKRQLEARLTDKPIQIRHFQSGGEPMRLDAGGSWVPTEGGSGDPNDGDNSIVDDPDSNATAYFLRNQIAIHRSAIRAIKDYLQKTTVQKATVNRSGDQRNAGSPSRFSR